tara:strand:+ start:530 stop:781 length:252 start_codon:yes stop_codon:yes gene_type:complete
MNIHQRRRLQRQAEALLAQTGEVWVIQGNQLVQEEGSNKHTEESLSKLTKVALEELGRAEFSIELDKRKAKGSLVAELLKAQG